MNNENEIKQENTCICKSKEFKYFVIVVIGSFIGAYMALSLFTAINKPCPCKYKMFPPFVHSMMPYGMENHMMYHKHFMDRNFKPDFKKFDAKKPNKPEMDFQ